LANPHVPILVIDDDPAVLRMLSRFLPLHGFVVTTTDTPFGATNLAAQVRPQLLIVDYEMPALNGVSLVEVMRHHPSCRDLPVLLYSGTDVAKLKEAVRRAVADDYVQKGQPLELLVQRVESLLARGGARVSASGLARTPRPG
jgi:chemosensory pili system protein ChpA (sensor histidine kinase/response regulator)